MSMMGGGIYRVRSMPGVGSMRPIPQRMSKIGYQYMGDPGFFGDLWGGIKGAATGLLTGGPLGAVGGAVKGFIGQPATALPPMYPTAPMLPRTMGISVAPPQQNGRPPSGVRVGGLLPGGEAPFIGMTYGPQGQNGAQGGEWMAGKASSAGYHWNKSGYFLKDGTWIAKGTRQVKNRRRNPLNPRALDRSISRITSAKRASKKLGRISIRKAASCR